MLSVCLAAGGVCFWCSDCSLLEISFKIVPFDDPHRNEAVDKCLVWWKQVES